MRKKTLAIIVAIVFVVLAATLTTFIMLQPEPTPPAVNEQSPEEIKE